MGEIDTHNALAISFPFEEKVLKGSMTLPLSKSESNRALMIAEYGGFLSSILHISDSNDTIVLNNILQNIDCRNTEINCEDAGTVARFLMTFLACRRGTWLLTGTNRLCQRPMGDLVDALRHLGASVDWLEKEGCLPVKILGVDIQGDEVVLNVEKSSQFASSLLLAAPMWPKGLKLHLEGNLNSLPYIDMTIAMMQKAGAKCQRTGSYVKVDYSPYQSVKQNVTSDWSAASYWFEMAALSDDCDLLLENLSFDSLQGDAIIAEMMRPLGVAATEEENGIRLKKGPINPEKLVFDFSNTPDLFPAVVVACAGLKLKARFRGVKNLALKESDRVGAMAEELQKTGAVLSRISDDEVLLTSSEKHQVPGLHPVVFNSHNDHRVAMALAPLALTIGETYIKNPQVVEKSYPAFWHEVGKLFDVR